MMFNEHQIMEISSISRLNEPMHQMELSLEEIEKVFESTGINRIMMVILIQIAVEETMDIKRN